MIAVGPWDSWQKLACDGHEVAEEYVETEYYKDLRCIDKQHHTVPSLDVL